MVQYPHEGIAPPTILGDYGLQKNKNIALHTFHFQFWYPKMTKQVEIKAR
jgi:hypothetical protein